MAAEGMRRRIRDDKVIDVYVSGNNALRLDAAVPQPVSLPRPRLSEQARANRERSMQMNFGYVAFLALSAVISVLICVNYLKLQSEYTALQKQATGLEVNLSQLKLDNDEEYLFGNDIDIDDIVWFGYVPSVKELAEEVGVMHSAPMKELRDYIDRAQQSHQPIHFLPQYRSDIQIQMADIFGFHPLETKRHASVTLIKAIVAMRRVKRPEELEELREAADIGYEMHVAAMRNCKAGVTEHHIAGIIEGIAMSKGRGRVGDIPSSRYSLCTARYSTAFRRSSPCRQAA